MLEFRKDPVIGRWVIISTDRGKRPTDFAAVPSNSKGTLCPFCAGNEHLTPSEIMVIRSGETENPGWSVRVVPNKYPALQIEGRLHRRADGIYDKMNGIGAHEVIIETPFHDVGLADLEIGNFSDVLKTYRARILDLKQDRRFRYVMIFKNHGRAAGASLTHSHSQLIATPIVPKRVSEELLGAKSYFVYKDRCIFCDIIDQETDDFERIIESTDHFIAISPYAPRFPFETWILPKAHEPYFENINDSDIDELASIFSRTLRRLNVALEHPPYNFLIHNSPINYKDPLSYHWHIEIMPKSTRIAGFEWGTGFYINHVPPEESAKFLRGIVDF